MKWCPYDTSSWLCLEFVGSILDPTLSTNSYLTVVFLELLKLKVRSIDHSDIREISGNKALPGMWLGKPHCD